jgi:hypothetical protein
MLIQASHRDGIQCTFKQLNNAPAGCEYKALTGVVAYWCVALHTSTHLTGVMKVHETKAQHVPSRPIQANCMFTTLLQGRAIPC